MSYNAMSLQVLRNRLYHLVDSRELPFEIQSHNEEALIFARCSALYSGHSVRRVDSKAGG
jgi:hypothetical protein